METTYNDGKFMTVRDSDEFTAHLRSLIETLQSLLEFGAWLAPQFWKNVLRVAVDLADLIEPTAKYDPRTSLGDEAMLWDVAVNVLNQVRRDAGERKSTLDRGTRFSLELLNKLPFLD